MYDKEKLLKILIDEKYKTIDDDGKVFPPSHVIYRCISEALINSGSHVTPKHIYTILKNDRSGMYKAVLNAFSIDKKEIYNESKCSSFNETEKNDNSACKEKKKFKLLIAEEKWAQMKPSESRYQCKKNNKRTYVTLQKGKWTHIFADKIWQQTRIPCAFTFKRAKILKSSDAKYYAKFRGNCSECGAQLVGILYNKPAKKTDVIFECTLSDFSSEIQHKKTRQLRGELREKIASELVDGNKNANVWRNEEANRIMTFGDDIPPILYNTTVLRKAKQEEMDKRLQLENTDPIKNLYMAKRIRLIGIIHNIGLDPFYCMYWTQEQQLMYKMAYKDINSFLAIDATGSIGKKLRLPNDEKSSHLFLYQCVCVSKYGNFPSFQMVSAKQDAAIISYFFLEIIRNGAPKPRLVVTDFGKAILIAVARVFANCIDLNHYLQICYKVINDNCTNIPSCYMRLDVSHFIAMIARWDCLKNKATKIRQFFIRSLGRIYQTYNFNDTRIFLKSLLVVALSEELGLDNDGMKLPSEMYLMEINSIIKGVTIEDPNEHDNHECVEDDEIAAEGCWNTWAENIYFEAQEVADVSVNGTMANAYYKVEAAQKIKHPMCYLPLWTGIMRSHFKNGLQIATSSYVEAEFAELKTRNFKNQLPMRIDKFIFRHIEYLDSRLKVTCGSANQMADTKETESSPLKTFNNDSLINSSPKDNMELTHERELSSVKMLNESNLIKSKDNTDSIETEFSPVKTPSEDNATKLIENMDLIEKEWSPVKISDEEDNVVKSPSKDDNENNNESSLINVFNERNVTKSHFKHNDVNESFMNTDEENLEQKSLNEIENWRGKIKRKTSANDETRISKRFKSNYLAPCADWDFSNTNKTIGLPILKNGSLCKATTVKKKQIILSETCSFDSIFQVVANGIGMHST